MKSLKNVLKGFALFALPVLMLACATVPPEVPVQVEKQSSQKQETPCISFMAGQVGQRGILP